MEGQNSMSIHILWPTSILKGCFALLLNTILGEELIQAHACLKLYLIHLHG
jgi:hypothetical protein